MNYIKVLGVQATLPPTLTEENHLSKAPMGTSTNLIQEHGFTRHAAPHIGVVEVDGKDYWMKAPEARLWSSLPQNLTNLRIEYTPGFWGPTLNGKEIATLSSGYDGYQVKVYGDLTHAG
jgi:hypothetical protein